MEFKVSLERIVITAPDSAPVLTDWLSKEAARWISHTHGQVVEITIARRNDLKVVPRADNIPFNRR